LKPGDPFFKECTDCPRWSLCRLGVSRWARPETESDRSPNEGPQHEVTIAKTLRVARFELTFDEWDACAAHGDCDPHISASGWGRGGSP